MAFMLLILERPEDRGLRPVEDGKVLYEQMRKFGEQLTARGVLRASESLLSHAEAVRIEVRDGKHARLDGPFAEAKEMVGGFFLLDCETREEAVEIARQCPAAAWATVEVREVGPCFGA